MKQALIYLTDQQHEALRAKAFVQKTSMTALVREAVDRFLASKPDKKESGDMPFE